MESAAMYCVQPQPQPQQQQQQPQQKQVQPSLVQARSAESRCEALRHVSDSAQKKCQGQQVPLSSVEMQCEALEAEVTALDAVIHDTSMLCASLEASKQKEKSYTETCEKQLAEVRTGLDALAARHQQFTASLSSVEAVSHHVQTIMNTLTQPSSRLCQLVEKGKNVVGTRSANDFRSTAAELRRRHAYISDRLKPVSCGAEPFVGVVSTLTEWSSGSWQQHPELAAVLESVRTLCEDNQIASKSTVANEGDDASSTEPALFGIERLIFTDADATVTEFPIFLPLADTEDADEKARLGASAKVRPSETPTADALVQRCVHELEAVAASCHTAMMACRADGIESTDMTPMLDAFAAVKARWSDFLATYQRWAAQYHAHTQRLVTLSEEEALRDREETTLRSAQVVLTSLHESLTHERDVNDALEAEVQNYHKAVQCALSAAQAQDAAMEELTARHAHAQEAAAASKTQYANLQAESTRDAQAHADAVAAHEAAMTALSRECDAAQRDVSCAEQTVHHVESVATTLNAHLDQLTQCVKRTDPSLPATMTLTREGRAQTPEEAQAQNEEKQGPEVATVAVALRALACDLVDVRGSLAHEAPQDEAVAALLAALPSAAVLDAVLAEQKNAGSEPAAQSLPRLAAETLRAVFAESAPCGGVEEGDELVQRALARLTEACPWIAQAPHVALEHYVRVVMAGYDTVRAEQANLDTFVRESEEEIALLERELGP